MKNGGTTSLFFNPYYQGGKKCNVWSEGGSRGKTMTPKPKGFILFHQSELDFLSLRCTPAHPVL